MASKQVPKEEQDAAFLRTIAAKRVALLLKYPFFGTLAMYLTPTLCGEETCPYMATDGGKLLINPAGMKTVADRYWEGIIAHEVLHAALNHCLTARLQHRDTKRWNIACDIVVNGIIDAEKLELPPFVVRNQALAHLSAEAIYSALPENAKPDPRNHDIVSTTTASQTNEADWKERIVSAYAAAKIAGKSTKAQERLAKAAAQGRVDWKSALSRFLTPREPTIDNWNRPSRRSIQQGTYLPSKIKENAGSIVIAIDTSASVSTGELNQFAAEVAAIQRQFRPSEIKVLYVDYRLNSVETFTPDQPIELHPKGGGGTRFKPAFDYVASQNEAPECMVYLTDGDASYWELTVPEYPVLWAITTKDTATDVKPPFGDVTIFTFD